MVRSQMEVKERTLVGEWSTVVSTGVALVNGRYFDGICVGVCVGIREGASTISDDGLVHGLVLVLATTVLARFWRGARRFWSTVGRPHRGFEPPTARTKRGALPAEPSRLGLARW